MKKRIFLSIVVSMAVTLMNGLAGGDPAAEGAVAPSLKLQDLDGKIVSSDDFKGKVVILDFWATWCGPCRAEIPGLIELQKTYEKQGLVVVGIALDEGGASTVKPFVKKEGINYTVLLGDDTVQKAFGGIDAIPVGIIIDRQGHIAKKYLGLTGKAEFESQVKPLLK